MKFTKASVTALRVPAGKTDHFEWDDATPGFGVRLRGVRRTWVAQIRVHGRTRRITIGNVAQLELDAARAAARKFFADGEYGKDPRQARQDARAQADVTFGKIVEKYLAAREGVARANTRRHQIRYLRQYFKPLHPRPIDSITRRDVAMAVADLVEEHGPSSAKNARAVLSAFFTWALKAGIMTGDSNPVTFTNDPHEGATPRERKLRPEEVRAIWRALPDTDYGRLVRLVFFTACRRSEIAALEWSEVDLDRALLIIPAGKMKGGAEHRLPLVSEAVQLLRSMPRHPGSPYVFGGKRGFTSFSYCNHALKAALTAMGDVVEEWGLHDIRRTIRTALGELGVDPWIGETILAHKRGGIEAVYNLAKLEKQMRQALGLWADRLRSIVEETESNVVPLRA